MCAWLGGKASSSLIPNRKARTFVCQPVSPAAADDVVEASAGAKEVVSGDEKAFYVGDLNDASVLNLGLGCYATYLP